MLNDDEAPPSGQRIFIRKLGTDFLSVVFWYVSHISRLFELLAENLLDRYRDAPLAEKIFSFESQTQTSY
jgi:hypothetical protein